MVPNETIDGKMKGKATRARTMPPPTLAPYTGGWTIQEASHLLRRTTFGPDQAMIKEATELGMQACLDLLFENAVPSPPPLRHTVDEPIPGNNLIAVFDDPDVEYGETWVNEPPYKEYPDPETLTQVISYRNNSVLGWNVLNMARPELNILPKLWLFWHNHFVVADFTLPHEMYDYSALIHQYAKGDFRQLTKEMTINVAMLRYLNGNSQDQETIRPLPNKTLQKYLKSLQAGVSM